MLQQLIGILSDTSSGGNWALEAKKSRPPLIHYVVLTLGVLSALLLVAIVVYVLAVA